MAYKFFNIGKANAEIDRLEAELVTAKESAKAAAENAAEVEKDAEKVSTELTQARADLATAKQTISTATARAEKAEADLKVANDKLANPGEQIKIKASQEAQKITAGQGQPPIESKTPAAGAPGDILAQHAAIKDSTARTVFYRANKAAYDAAFKAKAAQDEQ